ncbi:MAG: hypothetical protein J0H49_10610 [Acidobacteria bacterium]|nr:hypothetical protein [Acidobacteriota bacterium]
MLNYAKVAAWIAVTFLLMVISQLVLSVRDIVDQAPMIVQTAVHAEVALLRADTRAEIAETRKALDHQLTAIRVDGNRQMDLTRAAAVNQLDQLQARVDGQLGQANESIAKVAGLRDDIQPVIHDVNTLAGPIGRNTLGLIAAAKVTAGETAKMSRQIQMATPELIASSKRIADNSDRTTASTAGAMRNVQEFTRPLPRWIRLPLQLVTPSVPLVLSLR